MFLLEIRTWGLSKPLHIKNMRCKLYSGTPVIRPWVLRQCRFYDNNELVESWQSPRRKNALKTSINWRDFMPDMHYPKNPEKRATNWRTKWKCRSPVHRTLSPVLIGSAVHSFLLRLIFHFSPLKPPPVPLQNRFPPPFAGVPFYCAAVAGAVCSCSFPPLSSE